MREQVAVTRAHDASRRRGPRSAAAPGDAGPARVLAWSAELVATRLGPGEHGLGETHRAALVLLTTEAVGGAVMSALPAAVAVELLHRHLLRSDDEPVRDVLSDSGRPWAATAIRWLTDCAIGYRRGRPAGVDISLDDSIRMAETGPASLFGLSCALGALAGDADADQVESLRAFGRHLGMALCLRDDLRSLSTTSMPVAFALESGTRSGVELADLCRGSDQHDLGRIRDLVADAGGLTWAHQERDRMTRLAEDSIDAAGLASPAGRRLLDMLHVLSTLD